MERENLDEPRPSFQVTEERRRRLIAEAQRELPESDREMKDVLENLDRLARGLTPRHRFKGSEAG